MIEDEWPLLAQGRMSDRTQEALTRVEARVDTLDLTTTRAQVSLQHWLDQQSERREGRRARLIDGTRIVPDILWLGLLLGAALVLGFTLMLADPRERGWVQTVVMGSIATTVLTGLLVVRVLDMPYQNGLLAPTEKRVTLQLMDGELGAGGPCTGEPVLSGAVLPAGLLRAV